jgi:hypothetical protein
MGGDVEQWPTVLEVTDGRALAQRQTAPSAVLLAA